jgi:hypothetical protein
MNSTTLVLRLALDISDYRNVERSPVSNNSERVKQYSDGLSSFFKLVDCNQFSEILFVDNTLEGLDSIPGNILKILPPTTKLILTKTNKFGRWNKGAGDVETYLYLFSKDLIKSKYIFHFEPRLILKNTKLIDDFFLNPRSIFSLSSDASGIQTGYMMVESKLYESFCTKGRALRLTIFRKSIEVALFRFVQKRNVEIWKNFKCCERIDPVSKRLIRY